MNPDRFSAAPILSRLKDFQQRTVDYVFERLYGPDSVRCFLVADEVGLGKTLVARGVIARAIEHLQDTVGRIDIIYVCSNATIASQNINRLNVSGNGGFAMATRLTFLPMQVEKLAENHINFVSFTPGTALDLKGRSGRVEERALIYRMLRREPWIAGKGLLNLLRATVTRKNWLWYAHEWKVNIDEALAQAFKERVRANENLVSRLGECCERFRRLRKYRYDAERYSLIGELRHLLAETCLNALEPNLVILDEFQRFKHLLDGDDSAARLAQHLFHFPGVRTLLLSATPYKMLSLDHEIEDDHYPDFLRTLSFLLEDPKKVSQIKDNIKDYRRKLFAIAGGDQGKLGAVRNRLQKQLLKVMCRTERVGMTQRLDAMLVEKQSPAPLKPSDLEQAAIADLAAMEVGAREPIEYWKSSPYLLNFLRNYELRRRLEERLSAPPPKLLEAMERGGNHLLAKEKFESYVPLDPGNARLRVLFADTIDKGLWRLLWMPPSLPYMKPKGHYANIDSITKALVFSAWNLVPDAIAALSSYEAERRMVKELGGGCSHSELYDRVRPLLRFTKGKEGRLTGMPVIALLLPSPTLSESIDPLKIALSRGKGQPISIKTLLSEAEARCRHLLNQLPPGEKGNRPDKRWYWAAPALLDANSRLQEWVGSKNGWLSADTDHESGTLFRDHLLLLQQALNGKLNLGPRPKDLPRVMAELAIAGPGVCAHRALRRVAPELSQDDQNLLSAAAHIAGGFRTLYNLPETIALLRGSGEDKYWRLTLRYGIDGNLQALLDEQVHILIESLGLFDHQPAERVAGIAESIANALSIRTAQLKIDELIIGEESINLQGFNTRCRFALRFGDLRDDRDSTLARADTVREAFNSPFRPFILASTSIGQEGLDFHPWCHAVVHWNLPSNPVDLEQREGRVHRYKGHAVRKNVAQKFKLRSLRDWDGRGDPWKFLFNKAAASRPKGSSDLIPYWIYEIKNGAYIERRVPLLPFSREVQQLERLKKSLALYRLVFGQPRQEDLLAHLMDRMLPEQTKKAAKYWRISLEPPT